MPGWTAIDPTARIGAESVKRSKPDPEGYLIAAERLGVVGGPADVGREHDVTFWGASFVAAPNGQLLARAAHDAEAVLLATCDLTAVATMRQNWPFLRDRRVDVYDALTARFLDHGR